MYKKIISKKRKLSETQSKNVYPKITSQALTRAINSRAEKKYNDLFINDSTTLALGSSNGVLYGLNFIAEGIESNQRIGKSVTHSYLELDIQFQVATQAIQAAQVGAAFPVRYSIVFDRQPNGAAPAFTDIYDNATITNLTQTYRNVSKFPDRFLVLKSESFDIVLGQTILKKRVYLQLNKILKGRDSETKYNGTTAAVASLSHGTLLLAVCCDVGSTTAVGAGVCVFQVGSRYRYTDM